MRKILATLAVAFSLTLLGCGTNNGYPAGPIVLSGGCVPTTWTVINDPVLGVVWESDCGELTFFMDAQTFAEDLWSQGDEPEDHYAHLDPPRGPRQDYPILRIDDLTHVWESYGASTEESLAIPATDWEVGTTFVLMP